MQPDISILIVSYNTCGLTVACIDSVISETRKTSYEIIVLDNQSKDGSAEVISKRFPEIKLIQPSSNLGFAGGNNEAAKHATGKRLLLLNPDTVILNHAIDELVDYAEQTPAAKIWGGKAIFPGGSINASCWMDMTLWSTFCRASGLTYIFPKKRIFNPETIHAWDSMTQERSVDIVVGCYLMIDRQLWKELKGFNPKFYMYGDEVDLCLRAKRAGAAPRIQPASTIIHYGGGSEPSSEDKLIKVFKGRITVMNEHWHPFAARLGSLTMILATGLRAIASTIIKPPARQGAGQDQNVNVWGGAFRRRREWVHGWSSSSGESN